MVANLQLHRARPRDPSLWQWARSHWTSVPLSYAQRWVSQAQTLSAVLTTVCSHMYVTKAANFGHTDR